MSTECERYEDRLADVAAGRVDAGPGLHDHLRACGRCREELELLRAVAGAGVEPPEGLEARIRTAVRAAVARPDATPQVLPLRRRWAPRRRWALPLAAAAAVAALWVGVLSDRGADGDAVQPETTLAAEWDDPLGAWPAVGGEVAGEPVLSELSAEELEALLEEMAP